MEKASLADRNLLKSRIILLKKIAENLIKHPNACIKVHLESTMWKELFQKPIAALRKKLEKTSVDNSIEEKARDEQRKVYSDILTRSSSFFKFCILNSVLCQTI